VKQLPAKANAVVYPMKGEPKWVPGPSDQNFVELLIAPKLPDTAPAAPAAPSSAT
jgi:hypothetical protein